MQGAERGSEWGGYASTVAGGCVLVVNHLQPSQDVLFKATGRVLSSESNIYKKMNPTEKCG